MPSSTTAVAEPEGDEIEAKRLRKVAKRAAKEAAVAEAGENAEVEEAPKAKKSKRVAEDADKAGDKEKGADGKAEGDEVDKTSLKVFIRGLPFSKDETTLRKDFRACGYIADFQLPMDKEGMPKGYAFITFGSQGGFDAALKLNNTHFGGRTISVVEAIETGKGKGEQADWNCPNCDDVVFARNAKCRQCGTARPAGGDDDAKGKSKGKEGDWKCPSCNHLVFARNSQCRKCGTAKPGGGGGDENENTVFIRGLPSSVTEDKLQIDFGKCGEIVRLKLPLKAGKPNGISFIKYTSHEGVDAALKLDNTDYGGRTISVCKASTDGKGKGKDGTGKGKAKDKGKASYDPGSETFRAAFTKKTGCIVAGAGEKTTFADSDDE